MSLEREYKSREKKAQKFTKDGLIEKNLVTGEERRISKRNKDFAIKVDSTKEDISNIRSPTKTDNRKKQHRYKQKPVETNQPEAPAEDVREPLASSMDNADETQLAPETAIDSSTKVGSEKSKVSELQHSTRYTRKFLDKKTLTDTDSAGNVSDKSPKSEASTPSSESPSESRKLQFSKDELPSEETVKLTKLREKAEQNVEKLEEAKEKLPAKHRVRSKMVIDEQTGTGKHRLHIEKEVKTKGEHLKGSVATRPLKATGNAVLDFGHRKISEIEHENVGTEAAHKGERIVESGARSAYRFHKLRPYRRVKKLEQKSLKSSAKYSYERALQENPTLQTNPISRMIQKRKIQRQYAKAAKEAKRAGKVAKGAVVKTEKAVIHTVSFVKRHPALVGSIIILLLMIFFITSTFSSCSNMAGGGFAQVFMSSYTAEDSDILAVDAAYSELEAQLQSRMDNIENEYPGYDEYKISIPQIGHDPYELASYLTCLHYDYTLEEVQSELESLISEQYKLTISETVEVRYRTETRTDSEGNTYTVEVAYDYYILNVTLTNRGISAVASENFDADLLSLYNLYIETKGNKPDLFADSIYIGGGNTPSYTIPGEALSDERFAAMITEAEKYLGYPYVWGGSSPSTSFDCSGFVCWVINQSGVGSVGRTTANGLLNYCTVVSASEAQPGDLIFFQGTYNTSGASHVGIYVGNHMMIHCGNPIQYTSINTSYWQSHFYCFGRLPS